MELQQHQHFDTHIEPSSQTAKTMVPKTAQKSRNTGLACLDKPVLGQGGGGILLDNCPWLSWTIALGYPDRHTVCVLRRGIPLSAVCRGFACRGPRNPPSPTQQPRGCAPTESLPSLRMLCSTVECAGERSCSTWSRVSDPATHDGARPKTPERPAPALPARAPAEPPITRGHFALAAAASDRQGCRWNFFFLQQACAE